MKINKLAKYTCKDLKSSVGKIDTALINEIWITKILPILYKQWNTKLRHDLSILEWNRDTGMPVPLIRRPLNKNNKNYKKILKDYIRLCDPTDHINLIKPMLKDGYKGKRDIYIKCLDETYDLFGKEKHIISNDFLYNHIIFLDKWKEDLLDIWGGYKFGIIFQLLYTHLGIILNKIEKQNGHIIELMRFLKGNKKSFEGLQFEEIGYQDDLNPDWVKYGYSSYNGELFMEVTRHFDDTMGYKKTFNELNDNDDLTIYRSVANLDYLMGTSWSMSKSTCLDWGARRSDNGIFHLGEITIKKSDVFFVNSWTNDDTINHYCEVVVLYDDLDEKDVSITEYNVRNQRGTFVQLKNDLIWIKEIRNWLIWYNNCVIGYWNNIVKYRKSVKSGEFYKKFPKGFITRLWDLVSKSYDTKTHYSPMGQEMRYKIKLSSLIKNMNESEIRTLNSCLPRNYRMIHSAPVDTGIRTPLV